jgi:hypothetical protein
MKNPIVSMRSDVDKCMGIIFFTVDFPDFSLSNCFLKVVINSKELTFSLDKEKATFGIHLHLLNKGKHSIVFLLMKNDGAEIVLSENIIKLPEGNKLHNQIRESMVANKTPLIFEGLCDSSFYPYSNKKITPWFDKPNAQAYINNLFLSKKINDNESRHLEEFVKNGFVILENLIDDDLINLVNIDINDCVNKGYQGYKYGSSQRLEHLHLHYPNVKKLWLDKRHRRIVDLIFGFTSVPCQTLTYIFGSQQDVHQDLIHLTPFPAGYMCGTWIALQDISENSGELVVYPGSHRAKRLYMKDTGADKVINDYSQFADKVLPIWHSLSERYTPLIYKPKKGTVLIWHENLLHGGSLRLDQNLERRSFVIHSFAEGCVAFYDTSGLPAIVASQTDLNETQANSTPNKTNSFLNKCKMTIKNLTNFTKKKR